MSVYARYVGRCLMSLSLDSSLAGLPAGNMKLPDAIRIDNAHTWRRSRQTDRPSPAQVIGRRERETTAARRKRTGRAPGHPPQQISQQRGPGIIRYRGSSDCRILIVFHKPIMIAAAAPLRGSPDLHQQPHDHELLLP